MSINTEVNTKDFPVENVKNIPINDEKKQRALAKFYEKMKNIPQNAFKEADERKQSSLYSQDRVWKNPKTNEQVLSE